MESAIPLPWQTRETKPKTDTSETRWLKGVVPVLTASLLSGLAGSLAQRSLQKKARDSLLLSGELAAFSAVSLLVTLLVGSKDSHRIREHGVQKGWTVWTWIPICTNALGGILVGLVTKHAGAVQKGFALIVGMFLSGLLQDWLSHEGVTGEQWIGGGLAGLSLWMHAAFK